jgi:general secretion pathway protein K
LHLLEIDTSVAQTVVDWLDKDIDPRPNGGAEDDYYMLQKPPYRAANRLMASASELRLVMGMDAVDSEDVAVYDKLAPYVVALPTRTIININTALPPVLAMLANSLTIEDGESLMEARGEEGFEKVEDFIDQALLKDSDISEDGLDVKTDYFLLSSVAEFDNARSQLYSILLRSEQGVKVVMRSRGVY